MSENEIILEFTDEDERIGIYHYAKALKYKNKERSLSIMIKLKEHEQAFINQHSETDQIQDRVKLRDSIEGDIMFLRRTMAGARVVCD